MPPAPHWFKRNTHFLMETDGLRHKNRPHRPLFSTDQIIKGLHDSVKTPGTPGTPGTSGTPGTPLRTDGMNTQLSCVKQDCHLVIQASKGSTSASFHHHCTESRSNSAAQLLTELNRLDCRCPDNILRTVHPDALRILVRLYASGLRPLCCQILVGKRVLT